MPKGRFAPLTREALRSVTSCAADPLCWLWEVIQIILVQSNILCLCNKTLETGPDCLWSVTHTTPNCHTHPV